MRTWDVCTEGTVPQEGVPLISLTTLHVGSAIAYALAFGLPAIDAVFPLVPAETTIIALGVATARSGDPTIALLVVCAALGAFAGDNICYLLGRRFGPAVERRFFSSAKGARRRAWAERSLDRFGMLIIILCRFIPGGRTAVTLSCGLVGFPARRFVTATAISGAIWASFAFFLGRLGGSTFTGSPWAGLLAALGLSVVLTLVIEGTRRVRSRWLRRKVSWEKSQNGPQRLTVVGNELIERARSTASQIGHG